MLKNNTIVNYVFLSQPQYLSAYSLGTISSLLSIHGSATIIFMIISRFGFREIFGFFLFFKKCRRQTRRRPINARSSLSSTSSPEYQIYHRLVLGLSVMDMIVSTTSLVQPYLVHTDPSRTCLYSMARGTIATCTLGGFMIQFYLGSTLYNCLLSLYYLRTIRYQERSSDLSRKFEPWIHFVAISFPILFGILGIALEAFNPSLFLLGMCDFATYPWNCLDQQRQQQESTSSSSSECIRGRYAIVLFFLHLSVSVVAAIIGLVATWLVYWTVRSQNLKAMKWKNPFLTSKRRIIESPPPNTTTISSNNSGIPAKLEEEQLETNIDEEQDKPEQEEQEIEKLDNKDAAIEESKEDGEEEELNTGIFTLSSQLNAAASIVTTTATRISKTLKTTFSNVSSNRDREAAAIDLQYRKRMKAVGLQAIWYMVAFFNGFASQIVLIVLEGIFQPSQAEELENNVVVYIGILLVHILFPLQGCFNWLIYVRPRWVRWRDAYPDKSWWWCYRQVLSGHPAPTTVRTSHLQHADEEDLVERERRIFLRFHNITNLIQLNQRQRIPPQWRINVEDDSDEKNTNTQKEEQ